MSNLSVISLFSNASFIVQLVMLTLLFMSIMSWTIIINKWRICKKLRTTSTVQATNLLSQLEQNLVTLATIQSSAPYIGLFGTVWGIINAMSSLGLVEQATIAMVAPGISEALAATAIGLFAAIPAGIFYNFYINKITEFAKRYEI